MKNRIFAALLCLVLALVGMVSSVEAADSGELIQISEEEVWEILNENSGGIRPFALSTTTFKISKKDSKLYVGWTIKSTTVSSEIGVENLKVQQYKNGAWSTISTASYSSSNTSMHSSGCYYASAKSGTKYRATGTAYTIDNGTKKTLSVTTSELTF